MQKYESKEPEKHLLQEDSNIQMERKKEREKRSEKRVKGLERISLAHSCSMRERREDKKPSHGKEVCFDCEETSVFLPGCCTFGL